MGIILETVVPNIRFSLFSYFSATWCEQRCEERINIVEQRDKLKPDHMKLNWLRF